MNRGIDRRYLMKSLKEIAICFAGPLLVGASVGGICFLCLLWIFGDSK